jgi:hypothetical protein
MKKYILYLIILLFYTRLAAFGESFYTFASLISRANISLLSNDPAATFYQPAHTNTGLSLNYHRPFGFNELDSFQGAASISVVNNIFSIGTYFLNNDLISDNIIYLGYSRRLANISLCFTARYFNQRVTGYDRLDAFTLNLGAIWVTSLFTHGLSYSNVTNSSIGTIPLPNIFKYEVMISPLQNTDFALSFEKEVNYKERLAFAVSHNIQDIFIISTGFISNPGQFTAGMCISVRKIRVSFGIRTHLYLGVTSALSIMYLL